MRRKRDALALRQLSVLAGSDFADWRDTRLKKVSPGKVARAMNFMRPVLESARRDWHWIRANPMTDVSWPTTPAGRKRRVAPNEVTAMTEAFGVGKLNADTATQRVGLAFLLAPETAMRSGEMLWLHWRDIDLANQYVTLPRTKNDEFARLLQHVRHVNRRWV